jgi:hypothetical protein
MQPAEESIEKLVSQVKSGPKRALKVSLVYTVTSFIIGGGWVLYSFYTISELNKNASGKKAEIAILERDKAVLDNEIENVKQELQRRKDDLLKIELSEKPPKAIELPVKLGRPSVVPSRESLGFAYYGLRSGDRTWSERYFKKDSGVPEDIPRVGDRISSISSVNIRAGYITYDPKNGWINQPSKGVIRSNQRFEVLEVNPIAGNFIWVKLKKVN